MLTVTRRQGECIVIGGTPDFPCKILVRVAEVIGGRVRLSVDAPQEVAIDRAEIRAKKDAARTTREAQHGAQNSRRRKSNQKPKAH